MLFGFGFLLPLLWLVGSFVPLCTKRINDRRAGMCCAIAFLTFMVIVIIVTSTNPRRDNNRTYVWG